MEDRLAGDQSHIRVLRALWVFGLEQYWSPCGSCGLCEMALKKAMIRYLWARPCS